MERLSRDKDSLYYPNGWGFTRQTALRVFAVALLGVNTACQPTAVGTLTAGQPVKRVVYVSAVDSPSDRRGQKDYERFCSAVLVRRGATPIPLSIEFAEVTEAGREPTLRVMRDVVASNPDAIVASSYEVLEIAKGLTETIPVLFMSHADPVELGHVQSIAAPGVYRTGFTFYVPILAKSLELLLEAYPHVHRVGIVVDPALLESAGFARELAQARHDLALRIDAFLAVSKDELARTLRRPDAQVIDAWYLPTTDVLWSDREATLALMEQTQKPVLYDRTALARKAGAMSYEAHVVDPFGLWAAQVLLILDGTDTRFIPIERPSSFELAVNVGGQDRARPTPAKSILKRADVIVAAR